MCDLLKEFARLDELFENYFHRLTNNSKEFNWVLNSDRQGANISFDQNDPLFFTLFSRDWFERLTDDEALFLFAEILPTKNMCLLKELARALTQRHLEVIAAKFQLYFDGGGDLSSLVRLKEPSQLPSRPFNSVDLFSRVAKSLASVCVYSIDSALSV